MSIKNLLKAVALVTAFTLVTRILGFGFRIYLAQALGAEMLGLYSIALAFFGVFCSFVSSGIPITISKKTSAILATQDDDKTKKKSIGKLVMASIMICIFLSLIVLLFVFVLKGVISQNGQIVFYMVLVLVPAVLFSGIYSAIRGVFWGQKDFFSVCLTEFIEQVLRIVLCAALFFMLPGMNRALSAVVSLSISVVIAAVVTVAFYKKKKLKFASGNGEFKNMFKASMPISAVRFLGSLSQPLVSLIIPLRLMHAGYTQNQAVASLGVGLGMVFPLLFLPGTVVGSLAMALVPDLSGLDISNKRQELKEKIRSSIIFSLVVSAFFAVLFVAVGRQIGVVLFNNTESGRLLVYGALAMIFMSLSNISSAVLNSLGMEVKSMTNYMIGSIFLFVSIWFLPSVVGGGLSLIIGMGLCTAVASILNIIMIEKKIGTKTKYIKDLVLILVLVAACGAFGQLAFMIFDTILPMFVSALIGGLMALLAFAILLDVFKFVKLKNFVKKAFRHG